jgi:hypothetical protein
MEAQRGGVDTERRWSGTARPRRPICNEDVAAQLPAPALLWHSVIPFAPHFGFSGFGDWTVLVRGFSVLGTDSGRALMLFVRPLENTLPALFVRGCSFWGMFLSYSPYGQARTWFLSEGCATAIAEPKTIIRIQSL